MTLEEALKEISTQQHVDLLSESTRVNDMLGDLIPGEGDARKIRNRVKWAYDQGAIHALGSNPDHFLAKSKAVSILKSNTDLNESVIEETINAFCVALGWQPANTVSPAAPPVQTPPAVNPVPSASFAPSGSFTPKASTAPFGNSHNAAAKPIFPNVSQPVQTAPNHVVCNVRDMIDGRVQIHNDIRNRANRYIRKGIKGFVFHLIIELLFLIFAFAGVANNPSDNEYQMFVIVSLAFFAWEGMTLFNSIGSFEKKLHQVLFVLAGGIVMIGFFIFGMEYTRELKFSDFHGYIMLLFACAVLIGSVVRIFRICIPKSRK